MLSVITMKHSDILTDFETKYYLSVKLLLRWRSRDQKLIISDSTGKLDQCIKKMSCLLEIRS